MGNKQAKSNRSKESCYQFTSIESAHRPKNMYLSPDNSVCIMLDAEHQIHIHVYDEKANKFICRLSFDTKIKVDNIIYDSFHQTLLYWHQMECHQFTFDIDEQQQVSHRQEMSSLLDYVQATRIVNAHIFSRGNVVLLAVSHHRERETSSLLDYVQATRQLNARIFSRGNIGSNSLIAMKWNPSTQQYVHVHTYSLEQCDELLGVAFHEKRAKMVTLEQYQHHYYLKVHAIGQLLRCVESDEQESKIESMDKPHLLVCRLVYQHPHSEHTLLPAFKESDDNDSSNNANARRNSSGEYGSDVKQILGKHMSAKKQGVLYVNDIFFGVSDLIPCRLLFSYHGDKILYEAGDGAASGGRMLHEQHFAHKSGHSVGSMAGWCNDYGNTHLIDVNTAQSLWSTGSTSKSRGVAWTLNDYLVVFKSGIPSRCSFNLEGFESQTMIAECLLNEVIPTFDDAEFHGFSWNLCLLIAEYRGAPGRWYREITLCKCKNGWQPSLEFAPNVRTLPINAYSTTSSQWIAISVSMQKEKDVSTDKVAYKTLLYESRAIAEKAFGDEDVLIRYEDDNAVISRNLLSANDVFGEYFREAQNKRPV